MPVLITGMIGVDEAATLLGLSPGGVSYAYRRGFIRGDKVGSTLLLDERSVREYASKREQRRNGSKAEVGAHA